MKKMNKKIASVILAATMMGTMLTGCGGTKVDGTQIVATADGEEITLGMAHFLLRGQQAYTEAYMEQMAAAYGWDMSSIGLWDDEAEEGKTYGEQEKDKVISTIREMYGYKNHAVDYDIVLTEEDNEKIEAAAKQFMEDNSQKTLEALGVSESDLVTYLELVTLRERIHEPMVADVDREVSDEDANMTTVTIVSISRKGTEKDDDGNIIELTEDELKEKRDVLKEIAEAIEEDGDVAEADISEIAKEVDDSVIVATLSFVTADEEQKVVEDVIAEAVMDMEDGELSDILEGEKVYYLVRLDAMLDEEKTEENIASIIEERETEAYDALTAEWSEEVEFTLYEDVWARVELSDRQSFRYANKEE